MKIGDVFNKWTVISEPTKVGKYVRVGCRCECGAERSPIAKTVKAGISLSCGRCQRKPSASHGMRKAPEYYIWTSMKQRCTNPKDSSYPCYGGRGIEVCEDWGSFENFYASMGPRPKGMTLERKDVNGNYCPENVIWADLRAQANNRRNSLRFDWRGRSLPLVDIAEEVGSNYRLLASRLMLGMTLEQAVAKGPSRHNPVLYTYRGKTQRIKEWGRELGISPITIKTRITRGMTFEQAVTTPITTRKRPECSA